MSELIGPVPNEMSGEPQMGSEGDAIDGEAALVTTLQWEDDEGLRGRKAVVGSEYAIAQTLEDGYAVTWTTTNTAVQAARKCLKVGTKDFLANVCYDTDGQATLTGTQIIPFLDTHKCWWMKLSHPKWVDYVTFVAGPADRPDEPGEMASIGPPLAANSTDGSTDELDFRVGHIESVVDCTATENLQRQLPEVLPGLIETISS